MALNISIVYMQRKPEQSKLLKRWCACSYLIFPFMVNILQIKSQVHLSSGIYIYLHMHTSVCLGIERRKNIEIKAHKHLPSKSNCHFLQGLWSAFISWNSLFWRIQWGNPLWKKLVLINARGKKIYSGKNEDSISTFTWIFSARARNDLPTAKLDSLWSEGLQ